VFVAYIRADCLHAMRRYEESLEYRYTMVKLSPAVAHYHNLILVLVMLNRLNELKEVLNAAFRDVPEILEILIRLGQETYLRKEYEASIIIFKKIVEISKPSIQFYINLVKMLSALNRPEEALVYIDKALTENPNSYEMCLLKSEIYLNQKKFDELLNISEKLIELKPDDAHGYFIKSYILELKGNYGEVIDCLLSAKLKVPNNAEVYYQLSSYLCDSNRDEETIANAKKYIEMGGPKVDIYGILGKSQFGVGEFYEAITSLEKCCQLDPNNFEVRHNLAVAYSEVGQYDNALLCLNKVLEIEPNFTNSLEFKESVLKKINALSISKINENNKADNNFYNANKKNFSVLNKLNGNYWKSKGNWPMKKVLNSVNFVRMMKFIHKFK
jgi:tetratricopeptide (TPR) repeat protein